MARISVRSQANNWEASDSLIERIHLLAPLVLSLALRPCLACARGTDQGDIGLLARRKRLEVLLRDV